MKIYTTKDQIAIALNYRRNCFGHNPSKQEIKIAEQLESLNPKTATRRDIARIFGTGNDFSRTAVYCDECGLDVKKVIEFEPHNGLEENSICLECLEKAIKILKNEN